MILSHITLSLIERRWLGLAAGALVFLLAIAVLGHVAQHRPLPKELTEQLQRDQSARAADSVAIADARKAAAAADTARANATARATKKERAAAVLGAKAVAVAITAPVARTPQDSAARWRQAYNARVDEIRDLEAAIALKDSAIVKAEVRSSNLEEALDRSEVRAERSDALVQELTTVAESNGDSCRLLLFVPCPTRRMVAGVAVGATIVVVAVGRGAVRSVLQP